MICLCAVQVVHGDSVGSGTVHEHCSKKGPLTVVCCDSGGYSFDRGGRRMFETSYDGYKRGTFNLRRGHLWKDRCCQHNRRRLSCRKNFADAKAMTCCNSSSCPENQSHEHYSGQAGLVGWPSAQGPDNIQQARTKAFPYVATPIWLRDTSDASASGGYATPTSWQGFQ